MVETHILCPAYTHTSSTRDSTKVLLAIPVLAHLDHLWAPSGAIVGPIIEYSEWVEERDNGHLVTYQTVWAGDVRQAGRQAGRRAKIKS